MSYGMFVHAEKQEREARSKAEREKLAAQSAKYRRAVSVAVGHFPDLCESGPCLWLVWALVETAPAKRGAVLAHRRRLLLSRKQWAWDDVTVDPVTGRSLVNENAERKVA